MGKRPRKLDFRRKLHRPKKRLIFCLAADPGATAYLAALLSLCPDMAVCHARPLPKDAEHDFVNIARQSRVEPQAAKVWWKKVMLPWIDKLPQRTFAMTSHLFAAGPGDALLSLGVVPDVVHLIRSPRDIALAIWRRGWVPAQSANGTLYTLHPDNSKHKTLPGWFRFNEYQLCYWYALEMVARIEGLAERITKAGGHVISTTIEGLAERDNFKKLVRDLNLPEPDWATARGQSYRDTVPTKDALPPGDPDELEKAVREALVDAQEWVDEGPTKIDVAILTKHEIHSDLSFALLRLVQRTSYNVSIGPSWSNPTSSNRNKIAREFRLSERRAEWLGMIDNDTIPDGNFLSVVEGDADVVVFPAPIWVPIKSPEAPLVWNVQTDANVDTFTSGRTMAELGNDPLAKIASGGTGAILIRRTVLEHPKMRWPFKDVFDEDGVRIKGHDLEFCHRARKLGFKIAAGMRHSCEHYKTLGLRQIRALLSAWEQDRDGALRVAKQATDKLAEYKKDARDE